MGCIQMAERVVERLGDICSDISYGYTESATSENIGPKFLRITDITSDYIDWNSVPYCKISDEDYNKYKLYYNDIVIARTGATTGYNKQFTKDIDAVYASYLIRFRVDEKKANARYIYYYLKSSAYTGFVNNYVTGAAQPGINATVLSRFKIPLPDLATQKKIADILSAYDDLIENNLARISLLEKMASELYKEWFVRFRFPGHEAAKFVDGVPEGWEMRKLKELIEFDPLIRMKKGVEYRTIPMDLLSTDSMLIDTSGCEKTTSTSGAHFQNGDTLLARITPCLENGKTGFVNTLDDGETAVGSTEFIVMRSKLLSPHLVYFIARSEYFRKTAINSMNGADGRQRAKISKLQSLSYPLPTRDIIDEFSKIVEPFFEEIKNLNIQNHNLTKQRDLLLPRLMSGKLSVEPLLGQTA